MKFEGSFEGREIERRDARIPVRYDASVRCADGEVEAQILDVSGKGFRLRSRVALEPGCDVSLHVGKLAPVPATIRWNRGLECGGVFLESITF